MNTHVDHTQAQQRRADENHPMQQQQDGNAQSSFVDNRPEAVAQRKMQASADSSSQVKQLSGYQNTANSGIQRKAAPSGAPIQAMFGRFAMTAGRAVGGSILAGGVNEGIRRGVDAMGQQNQAGPDNQLEDTSVGNAASRVAARHSHGPQPEVPATGHSMVGTTIDRMNAHRSPNPIAEGAMEGPYGRSDMARRVLMAPHTIPAAMSRGQEAIHNGYDFATADPTTQVADVAGAGLDSLADMDPMRAAGTAARTGADLASSSRRQEAVDAGTGMVMDSGQRMGAQIGTGMLLSGGLRMVPVIGPAASVANTALTIGGALSSAGQTAESGGSMMHHLEERTAARRNGPPQ